jgi:hypothetical protein
MSGAWAGVTSDDPLEIARIGMRWGGRAVPDGVFNAWLLEIGGRLLRATAGAGPTAQSQVLEIAARALVVLEATREPDPELEQTLQDLYPGGVLGLAATLNTMLLLFDGAPARTEALRWCQRAMAWAARRVSGDRRCPHTPAGLAAAAAALQGELAALQGGDGEAAAQEERAAQRAALLSSLPPASQSPRR